MHKPLLVDLTVEEGQRLKVIYGSCSGFHAVDVDSGAVYDIYLPTHVSTLCTSAAFSITGNCGRNLVFDVFIVLSFVDGTLMSIYLINPALFFNLIDSDQHPVARHHHPPQHGWHRAVGLL